MLRTWLTRLRPNRRRGAAERIAIGRHGDRFGWVRADASGTLTGCGALAVDADLARRLRDLALPACPASAVLSLADGHLLQTDAPAVRPEELKAAARWKIKDLVDGRLDEMTIDVLFVGDDLANDERPNRQIFVAAARNQTIALAAEWGRAAGLALDVVEIAETAQRNLQSAFAAGRGLAAQATAALVRHGSHCLLTVCAGSELYVARRLDWDELDAPVAAPLAVGAQPLQAMALESLDFVDYGAEPDVQTPVDAGAEIALVVEIQRSLDLWERSWPKLPLAAFWVQAGPQSERLATLLEAALGQRVGVLDPAQVFAGYADAPADVQAAVLPLLGALLRDPTRRL